MYVLVRTSHFDRQLARFTGAHPGLRKRLGQLFRDLEADPFLPRLRLHPLKGELDGLYAVSLTHAYRITLALRVAASEIILLDISGHDEVYR